MRENTKIEYLISLSLSILLLITLVALPKTEAYASNLDLRRHLVGEWETQLKVNNVKFNEPSIFSKETFYKNDGKKETVKFSLSGDNLLVSIGESRDIQNAPLTYQEGKFIYIRKFGGGPDSVDQMITEVIVNCNGNKIGFNLNLLREVRNPNSFLVLDYTYKNTTDRVIESIPQTNSEEPKLSLSEQTAILWESLKEALAGESFQVKTPSATCGVRG